MEIYCPECRIPLEIRDGRTAACPNHGDFQVMFLRPPVAAPKPPLVRTPAGVSPATIFCAAHPQVPAIGQCAFCNAAVCPTCRFVLPDQRIACPKCAVNPAEAEGAHDEYGLAPEPRSLPPAPSGLGVPCVNHAAVEATRRCTSCGAAVCATCLYKFPGGLFMCPKCAAAPRDTLSPTRRNYLIGSFVCAVIATLFMVALFAGLLGQPRNETELQMLGIFFTLVTLGSTIPGIALATSARLPGHPAPMMSWIALAWNGLVLAAYLLLTVIGNLKG